MKKILQLTYLIIILIAFNINTFGQQFGIKASGGLSKLNYISVTIIGTPPSIPFVPSGQAGVYYHLPIGHTSSLGTELLFSQIEGKVKGEKDFINPDETLVGHETHVTNNHISCLSLPVYYGLTINHLTFNAGLQFSYLLAKKEVHKSYGTSEGSPFHYETSMKMPYIDDFDFGTRAGIVYHLTDKLSVEGMYYYGLKNIYNRNISNSKLKIQQMTVGVRYVLWNNTKNQ